MPTKVKTRFAPSPTGLLHLGSVRTALFNWLWAKKNQGEFILRLEDTDRNRLVEGAQEQIMADLSQLGLTWDYGPDKPSPDFGCCIQSQRLSIYKDSIQPLIDKGVAYYDWTSPDRLTELRTQAQANKQPFVFRKSMATLEGDQSKAVIRIAMPDDINLSWQDGVKGQQSWQGKDIGDFVAIKSDGYPTYQFAAVVDDHLMEISHVIRGDEWLSSTPKHLYLLAQLGWQAPNYNHIAPILGAGGNKKLSKRDGAETIGDYIQAGYMPQALINFLALLGWNPGTEQEIFSIEELIAAFDLSRLQVSGSGFDPIRLDWMNGNHIRRLTPDQRLETATDWWPDSSKDADQNYKQQVLELVFERLKKWSELESLTAFFFQEPAKVSDEELQQTSKLDQQTIDQLIATTVETLQDSEFSVEGLKTSLYQIATEADVKTNNYFMLLRLRLTGSKVAPGLMETMHVIGKDNCLARLGG